MPRRKSDTWAINQSIRGKGEHLPIGLHILPDTAAPEPVARVPLEGLSTISTNAHSVPGDHQGQVQGCVTYQVMSLQRCAEAFPSLKGQFFSCTSWGAAKRSFGNFMEHELHTKHPVCMISLQQPWGNGCSEAPLQVRKLALRELSASPRGCKLHEGRG